MKIRVLSTGIGERPSYKINGAENGILWLVSFLYVRYGYVSFKHGKLFMKEWWFGGDADADADGDELS